MLSKRYLVDSLLLTFVVCASTYAQSFKDLPNYGPWGNGPSYGLRWSLNATDPGTWIAYSSTTLQVPGPAQQANSSTGALGFYPAMTDRNGDIIQSVIATFAQTQSNASFAACIGNTSYYCLFPYYDSPTGSFTLSGDDNVTTVTEGDSVRMEYRYDYDQKFYNQTIWKNGQTVITDQLQTAQNPINVPMPLSEWGPRVECVNNFTGIAPAHRYHDTTIVLNQPEPDLVSSLHPTLATNTQLFTNDNGLTWTIETIELDEVHCP